MMMVPSGVHSALNSGAARTRTLRLERRRQCQSVQEFREHGVGVSLHHLRGHEAVGARAHDAKRERASAHHVAIVACRMKLIDGAAAARIAVGEGGCRREQECGDAAKEYAPHGVPAFCGQSSPSARVAPTLVSLPPIARLRQIAGFLPLRR